MTGTEAIEITRAAMMLLLTLAGPLLIASLIVGAAIGLLQALTQIQEMTLTFVPKMIVLALVLLVTLPLMGQSMARFMDRIVDLIVAGH
ncbi:MULTISPECIES: flagellar biosynthetic protein FliQ [Sphingomonas]|jgi:flagellar biosynthetic protein FliQ|uniref:flagellar biosynthetic protein FliQ n=1 Tax=Sphingomonas TaxID=13687 RepID=UPI00160F7659|nr:MULTISPECIES: flagellar biosynthetic protein FliQ [Sphingomonas]MBB3345799.1 flagellar biosynthetic protein FliQ [Sphingomonas sp. BK069]